MPTPPKRGETKEKFMSRCMRYHAKEKPDMGRDQAAAICNRMWNDRGKADAETPALTDQERLFLLITQSQEELEEYGHRIITDNKAFDDICGETERPPGPIQTVVVDDESGSD